VSALADHSGFFSIHSRQDFYDLRSKKRKSTNNSLKETRQRAGVSVTVITIHPEETKYNDLNEHYALIDFIQRNGIWVRTTKVENEHYAVMCVGR
jgi:hypothetical protein